MRRDVRSYSLVFWYETDESYICKTNLNLISSPWILLVASENDMMTYHMHFYSRQNQIVLLKTTF